MRSLLFLPTSLLSFASFCRNGEQRSLLTWLAALAASVLFAAALPAATPAAAQSFSAKGLGGVSLGAPTSLQFGPDGRLYVSQQNGEVSAFTIERSASGSYTATATETISLVQDIPNHNDDGTPAPDQDTRQVTGLVVTGTASAPVLYVGSSDPRIGAGGGGNDLGLDTNSGILSKLTCPGGLSGNACTGGWEIVHLVRGLPRSEENHATNGLELDESTNTLLVAQGGHANAGAPSNNFAFTNEYALSAAVLEIDLGALEAMPTQTDAAGQRYKYDLPTLDDPDRAGSTDAGDPFGGNNGLNMAKVVAGGPVQIYSPGYRNPYDLVLTEGGELFVVDNGANGGWGGYPQYEESEDCTNAYLSGEPGSSSNGPNPADYPSSVTLLPGSDGQPDGSVNNRDNLHHVSHRGYYAGHPNPIRANPTGAGLYTRDGSGDAGGVFRDGSDAGNPLPADWPAVPEAMANPVECDYRQPGQEDGALYTWPRSTNGLTEYTASNFDGALQGDLLTAEFDDTIFRVQLDGSGTGVAEVSSFASSFGALPLDVTAQGDDDPFSGTVWAATYGANNITIFEPGDYDGGDYDGGTCDGDYDDTLDADGDDYSNADEIDNGTDPCSAADRPADHDGSFAADGFKDSNLADPDDDDDGRSDATDPFAIDPDDGTTTALPVNYDFFNETGVGFGGVGFTGLMTNGTDYADLLDPDDDLILGGTSGLVTDPSVGEGDNYQNDNTQVNALQFGVDVDANSAPFTVETQVNGPFTLSGNFASEGVYIGNGDQDNYLKVVLTNRNNSAGGFQVLMEEDGTAGTDVQAEVPGILDAQRVTLFLDVDPSAGTVQARYAAGSDEPEAIGAPVAIPAGWLSAADAQGLAVGLIATSTGNADEFDATWDYVNVTPTGGGDGGGGNDDGDFAEALYRINAGGDAFTDVAGNTWTADAHFDGGDPFGSAGGPPIAGTQNDALYQTERYGGKGEATFSYSFPVSDEDGTLAVDLLFAEIFQTEAGTRVFDLTIEGDLVLEDYDIFADVGAEAAATKTFDGLTDADGNGTLDVSFDASVDNAKVSAIAVRSTAPPNQAPQIAAFDDQTGTEGDDVSSLFVSATDPDGGPENLAYSLSGQPAGVTIEPTNGQLAGTLAEGAADGSPYDVTATVSDGADAATTSFTWTVTPADDGGEGDGNDDGLEVVARINAGGSAYTDGAGEAWEADDANSYFDGGRPFAAGEAGTEEDMEIAGTDDDVLYRTERSAAGDPGPFAYAVPVPSSGTYTVNLSFAEIYFGAPGGGAGGAGKRVFSVNLEGGAPPELDGYDINADVGPATATTKTFTVDVTDGVLDFAFTASANRPKVSAIEILGPASDDGGGGDDGGEPPVDTDASAFVTVNDGASIDASTFGANSFQIENTGSVGIESVSFDLSTAVLPDMVFDPNGTAGDAAAKCLVPNTGAGATGYTAPGDACADPFSQPHDGTSDAEGFDVLSASFGDFQNGEVFGFAVDVDPTSIKDQSDTGDAGAVSGFELIGAAVTVTFADGATLTADLRDAGTAGSAQAVVAAGAPDAPVIEVQGTDPPATVTNANQTLLVTGPPGATLQLLQMDARLYINEDADPDGDGTPGYETEPFEANEALARQVYTITLDPLGRGTIGATLLETQTPSDDGPDGGLNHFVAVVEGDAPPASRTSNSFVLNYDADGDDENDPGDDGDDGDDGGGGNDGDIATLAGTVTYYDGRVLENAILTFTGGGDQDEATFTDPDGSYQLFATVGDEHEMSGSKNLVAGESATDGVNGRDLSLIQRHITAIDPLGSAYKEMAADVNSDGAVNGQDLSLIQQLILTQRNGFGDVVPDSDYRALWRCAATGAADFASLMTARVYDPVTGSQDEQDFFCARRGDVDGSWTLPGGTAPGGTAPAALTAGGTQTRARQAGTRSIGGRSASSTAPPTGAPVRLSLDAAEVVQQTAGEGGSAAPGEETTLVTVPVRAEDFDQVGGVQFTLAWDADVLAYESIGAMNLPGLSASNVATHRTDEGFLALVWTRPDGTTRPDGAALFELRFRVKDADAGQARLDFSSDLTAQDAHRVTGDGSATAALQAASLQGKGASLDVIALPEQFVIDGSYPNPFRDHATVAFELPEDAVVRLGLYDMLGRRVFERTAEVSAGTGRELSVEARSLSSGVYLYRLTAEMPSGTQVKTGRMTLVR